MSVVWLIVFLAAAGLVWLSTLGYVLSLSVLRLLLRRAEEGGEDSWPAIAVVVPTLNEQEKIGAKLEDLMRSDYPADRVRRVVVDAGSRDRTADIVRRIAASDERLEFIHLPEARSKAEQVRTVLHRLREDIVVFTDADSRLDPSCIRRLVAAIQGGRDVALAAAAVSPETRLSVERLHWLFVNSLWWLEGEVLSCAGLSGVCYALRRKHFLSLPPAARAEDMRLGAMACMSGKRVVLSRRARATELRVPATSREFLDYRRRRGSCYLSELLRAPAGDVRSRPWSLARSVRVWQMTVLPWLSSAALVSGGLLLATRFRPIPPAVFAGFALTAYAYALAVSRGHPGAPSPPALAFVLAKYAFLLVVSLFGLVKKPDGQGPRGGQSCGAR
jgi:cellulose synthase/poly-beta-1,6-N-acetylglucosamine synthase-like glycosyltransferase